MGFWDFLKVDKPVKTEAQPKVFEAESGYAGESYSNFMPVRTVSFDGEKTTGELGAVLNVLPDYISLRLRSHEADLKSDVVKIINNKFFKWIIGTGLKLQAEPKIKVLAQEKINVGDLTSFKENTEARFNFWAKLKESDYKNENSLHKQANNALKTTFLGGDALVILRVENGDLNVQLVDGQQVQSPSLGTIYHEEAKRRGNYITYGIEKDQRGRHIAYYVLTTKPGDFIGKFERVPVYGEKTKRKLAWFIYFDKHRIDHDRGIGALPPILEKVEKLDRYTEAIVGGAEESAKIPFFFTHDADSTGQDPLGQKLKSSVPGRNNTTAVDGYAEGEKKVKEFVRTTSKMAINLPKGADIKAPTAGSVRMEYPEFWKAVFNSLAAAVDIPPEVAMQMYNSNYSASRAAVNAWEHLMLVYREKFTEDFYQPIYEVWLELEVLKSKITAPGYLAALTSGKWFGVKAYANARFTGDNMPHIDPVKEVKAVREMLGDAAANVPLITFEQATEKLNGGAWDENYKKHLEESKIITPDGPDKD